MAVILALLLALTYWCFFCFKMSLIGTKVLFYSVLSLTGFDHTLE